MAKEKVYGIQQCYEYSLQDTVSSKRHRMYYDSSKRFVIKLIPNATDEMKRKINFLINFKVSFEDKNTDKYAYLVSAFPVECIYSSADKKADEWIGFVMERSRDSSLDEVGIIASGFKAYFNCDSYVKLLNICASLCNCCQLLHRNKFLLSDIKPDNFYVTRDGKVYPLDTDGFSYNGSNSQPPLPRYCPNEVKHNNEAFYTPNVETESYALTVLLLQILTGVSLTGKQKISELRSYDLIGYGKYSEVAKNTSLGECKQAVYKRWFLMPESFRKIFLDVIYNCCYDLPTASGWYERFVDYIEELEEKGKDFNIVPTEFPECTLPDNPDEYINNVKGIQSIRVLLQAPKSKEQNIPDKESVEELKVEIGKLKKRLDEESEQLDSEYEVNRKLKVEIGELEEKLDSAKELLTSEYKVKRKLKVVVGLLLAFIVAVGIAIAGFFIFFG